MLLGGGGKKIAVFRQQNGDIEANVTWVTTNNPIMTIAMDDLNGDNLTDMASSNMDGNSVSIWLQMNNFTATWTSNALIQPMMIEDITFTYLLEDAGAESRLHFSLDETNWTEIVNDTNYDIQGRPDCLWLRFVTTSPNLSTFDRLHWLKMDLICSSYPSDIQIDVGADGEVDWEMTGELNYTDEADGFEDAITAYVQDPDSLPGPGDWVNVPLLIRSETVGHLEVLGIHVTYNNASAQPMLLGPTNDTYANSTPIFRFQAADSNDDRLIYVVQITKTDFDSVFDTLTFDGRFSLYNDVPGEGFSLDRFPSGSTAEFTLPWIYALEVNQTFKWRVLAYDGHLMSEASETFEFRVDAKPPVGQAYSPSYSSTLDFIVNWSAVDDMPGSGLALSGTYDVQYRSSTDSDWTDWLIGTELVEATFSGEEAMTYHFRMRARDAVMNVGRYAEDEGDTTTTVDTLPPTLEAISPTPGQAVTSGTVALQVEASDVGKVLIHGQVEFDLDGTGWTDLPLLPGETTIWRYFLDTSLMLEGDHTVEFRATDQARHVTRVSVAFVVDNTDPTCEVISPKVGEVVTGTYTVKVKAGDNLGIGSVDLVFKGIPGIAEAAATYNEPTGYWEIAVDTTLMGEGEATVTAQTIDSAGRRSPVIGPIAFEVDNLGPTILILEPLGNEFLTGDRSKVRVAISDMHLPEVKDNVDVSIDLGAWTVMAYSSGEYSFDWYIGTVADGEHEIVVRARDAVGQETVTSIVAWVDNNPPSLAVIDPQPGDILAGTVTLTVTVEDPFLDLLQFNIDGGEWVLMEGMETDFKSSLYPDGPHNLIIRAVDLRGQETAISLQVTFDNTPPQVVVSMPLPDEHVGGRVQFV
ncbi:MAG: hypothetical protein KAS77_00180, partial [Thermoplasmata archaeon]|nr:hypothetical protein [Thermoplasmata archaeon]